MLSIYKTNNHDFWSFLHTGEALNEFNSGLFLQRSYSIQSKEYRTAQQYWNGFYEHEFVCRFPHAWDR